MKEDNLGNISLKMDIERILQKIGDKYNSEQIKQKKSEIYDGLAILTNIEKEVLMLNYGLNNGTKSSLSEIAEKFDCTFERARRTKHCALAKLRRSSEYKELECLLDYTEINLERIFLKDGKFLNKEGNEKIPKKIIGKIQFHPQGIDEFSIGRRALDFNEKTIAYIICKEEHVGAGNYRIPIKFYKI